MDHGAKIFDLARSDALFAFAGDTKYAYPLAMQLKAAVDMYPRSSDRRFPLMRARGHLLRVFTQIYRSIHSLPAGQQFPLEDNPRVQFLFGGFNWIDSTFRIWYIDLNRTTREFQFRRARNFFFIGDREPVAEARGRTMRLLGSRGRSSAEIDMEPFEVLRDIIREGVHPDVGGAPQIAKVYPHMNVQFFLTSWPTSNGQVQPHAFGRPLRSEEIQTSWPVVDPDVLHFAGPGPRGRLNGLDQPDAGMSTEPAPVSIDEDDDCEGEEF